jgi:hypothetical protein
MTNAISMTNHYHSGMYPLTAYADRSSQKSISQYKENLHIYTSTHLHIQIATPPLVVPPAIALLSNNKAMPNTGIRQILGENLTPRTFFDYGCYEFEKKFTWAQKVQRIAEVVDAGYDLKRFMRGYIRYYNRPGYAHLRGSLETTLNMLLHFIQTGEEWKHFRTLPYGNKALPLVSRLILELRKDMHIHPEKYPFLKKKKAAKPRHYWYKQFELEQLLEAYLMEDPIYHEACVQQLGLDIINTNGIYWKQKDVKQDVSFPYSYQHLESLLQRWFLPGLKGNISLNDIRLDMGCSANQFYYLKLWSYNYNKPEAHKRELLQYFTMDILTRLYGRRFQRMPIDDYTIIDNWIG